MRVLFARDKDFRNLLRIEFWIQHLFQWSTKLPLTRVGAWWSRYGRSEPVWRSPGLWWLEFILVIFLVFCWVYWPRMIYTLRLWYVHFIWTICSHWFRGIVCFRSYCRRNKLNWIKLIEMFQVKSSSTSNTRFLNQTNTHKSRILNIDHGWECFELFYFLDFDRVFQGISFLSMQNHNRIPL